MSRRAPDPAAERAARNTATLKTLVKLEVNKSCADCKRNKHPRWASWNLGVFICIRCSGIHRGMGTHISRVKSVDLDSWTDEQLQSVLKWGNSRANKYWEAKLAPGHIPSEAKIENFIRTKYDSKRWVMDGPIPDPSTLDADGDDDVPLNVVKERVSLERSASQRAPSSSQAAAPSNARRAPQPDLFGDDEPIPRASSTSSTTNRAPAAPPKQAAKPADSLLGLDFFGPPAAPPSRPASAAPAMGAGGQSRPDLKQSILSLYASAPKAAPQQAQQSSQGSYGGMQSPTISQQSQQGGFGGLNDAFSGLNFSSTTAPPKPQSSEKSAFSGLDSLSSPKSTTQASPSYGGNFFDSKPAPKANVAQPQTSNTFNSSNNFSAMSNSAPSAALTSSGNGLGDLFDFGAPAAAPPKQTISSPPPQSSVFNLSQPQQSVPKPQIAQPSSNAWNNTDAWGSNDAWGTADTGAKAASNVTTAPPKQTSSNDFGWGSGSLANQSIVPGGGGSFSPTVAVAPKPAVASDDDFGGWSSAAPVTPGATVTTASGKPAAGFGASEDLFSNVWQ